MLIGLGQYHHMRGLKKGGITLSTGRRRQKPRDRAATLMERTCANEEGFNETGKGAGSCVTTNPEPFSDPLPFSVCAPAEKAELGRNVGKGGNSQPKEFFLTATRGTSDALLE